MLKLQGRRNVWDKPSRAFYLVYHVPDTLVVVIVTTVIMIIWGAKTGGLWMALARGLTTFVIANIVCALWIKVIQFLQRGE